MNNKKSYWLALRALVVLVGLLQSDSFIRSSAKEFSKSSISFPFIIAAIAILGVVFVIYLQSINPISDDVWYKPSWFVNPFDIKQPLQFVHLASWYFLSVGAGCLFLWSVSAHDNWLWELLLSIGCGLWLGMKMCTYLFQKKIAH